MAKKRPVKIWVPRHNPSKDPKFHQAEMLEGAGKSTTAPDAIFNKGCVDRKVNINLFYPS
jgi:hypothetical protein